MSGATQTPRGDWIQTFTGKAFYPLDPVVADIDIEDIAHALAHQCRYGGHCRQFYSVAEHSVLLSQSVAPEHALWALLHDASEAYLVDVPRPVKAELREYREIEDRLLAAIAARFGLVSAIPPAVHEADRRILTDEAAQLMRAPPMAWSTQAEPLGVRVKCWAPKKAEQWFLFRYAYLTRNRSGGAHG